MKKWILVTMLCLCVAGCATYGAMQAADMDNVTPADVNNIQAAAAQDIATGAEVSQAVGTAAQTVGVVLGLPALSGVGAILVALSGLAGGFVFGKKK